jgi:hypothetical protein
MNKDPEANRRTSFDLTDLNKNLVDSTGNSKSHSWYESSHLWDSDLNVRFRARVLACSGITFVVLTVMLPVLFLVIIPSIIQSIVNDVIQADIENPSANQFQSQVQVKFTNVGSISAKMKLKSATLSWNGIGGGDLATLEHGNTISVKDNGQTTLSATAIVINETALSYFNAYAVKTKSFEWVISGTAKVMSIIDCDVSITKTLKLNGYNNFSISPVLTPPNVTEGTPDYLYTDINVQMFSASDILLNLNENLYYDMYYNDTFCAIGYLPNATFVPGLYNSSGITMLVSNTTANSDAQYQASLAVQSNFLTGTPTAVTLQNFYLKNPSQIPWLNKALSEIVMTTVIPPCNQHLLQHIFMAINFADISKVPYYITIKNVVGIPLLVKSFTGNIYYAGVLIAYVNTPNANIVVAPYETITTPIYDAIPAKLTAPVVSALNALVKDPHAMLNVTMSIDGMMQHYAATGLYYFQNNVPTNVSCTPANLC